MSLIIVIIRREITKNSDGMVIEIQLNECFNRCLVCSNQMIGDGEECSSEHWLALESPNDQLVSILLEGWTSLAVDQLLEHRLLFKYFFCRAREFWNQTWVTRFERPVSAAIRSKSWPSGLESNWKLAWSTDNCSSVKVVRTLFVLDSDLLVGVELDSSLQMDASCDSPSIHLKV